MHTIFDLGLCPSGAFSQSELVAVGCCWLGCHWQRGQNLNQTGALTAWRVWHRGQNSDLASPPDPWVKAARGQSGRDSFLVPVYRGPAKAWPEPSLDGDHFGIRCKHALVLLSRWERILPAIPAGDVGVATPPAGTPHFTSWRDVLGVSVNGRCMVGLLTRPSC